jgi:hypothetical protein
MTAMSRPNYIDVVRGNVRPSLSRAQRPPPAKNDDKTLRSELSRALLADVIGGEADGRPLDPLAQSRDAERRRQQQQQRSSAVHWVIMLVLVGVAVLVATVVASIVAVAVHLDWQVITTSRLQPRLPTGVKIGLPSAGGSVVLGSWAVRWWRNRH